VTNYINQHQPNQPVSATDVLNALEDGQLPSTSHYSQVQSTALLSTAFSGPINAASFNDLPSSQGAKVDQIVEQTSFTTTDTAIIHVSGMDNMPMLQLGDAGSVQPQDQLTIIGFPGNGDVNTDPTTLLTLSINQIFVSAIKPNSGSEVIQVGGNVEHGDSGGPALDSTGQVVGIVSFGLAADGQSGETSFLQTTATAKQLIQQANIDTTPSQLQNAWSQAFADYSSTTPGHWHQSVRDFQQLSASYPLFKAVSPFLQYATQQAQTETQTQTPGTPGSSSATGGLNTTWLLIGGLIVLVIIVFGGSILLTRSRRGGVATANGAMGQSTPSAYYGGSYGSLPPGAGQSQPQFSQSPPQTPAYPGQSAYQQPAQPWPQAPSPAPQPAYRPQAPAGLAAFGAPSGPVPAVPPASDSAILRQSAASGSAWRTWPCGHINRNDASFCGTCGESAPPAPIVRRIEQ
jgi:hypothetical protein